MREKLEIKPSSFSVLFKPFLRNDLVYHVVMTRCISFLLTLYTLKGTRIQLKRIRARFGTGRVLYDLGKGLRLEFDLSKDHDAFLYDYLLTYGHYEREVASILSKLVLKDTTFIDVGANIGYFTVLFGGSARTAYAFEPVPGEFEGLSRNVRLNDLGNVRAIQCAVSKQKGKVKLFESKISDGHDSTVKRFEHDKAILVDAVTLDETIEPSARNIVMKVDTEGSEMDVLLGARQLLGSGRVSAIVIEWARGIYPKITNLRDRFALYSSLGSVEVLDERLGSYPVRERSEIPDFCNLLIRIKIGGSPMNRRAQVGQGEQEIVTLEQRVAEASRPSTRKG